LGISAGALILRLRQLLGDCGRTAWGSAKLLKYLFTRDPVEIGLGRLSAESPLAVPGRVNRYVVTICSAATESRDVTLTIDVTMLGSPSPSEGHYAYFSKHLKAPPGAATQVEIQYDWQVTARFLTAGTPSPADNFWRGSVDRAGRCSVSAILLDPNGTRLEILTVYQERSE
jgi:hypothetical protein